MVDNFKIIKNRSKVYSKRCKPKVNTMLGFDLIETWLNLSSTKLSEESKVVYASVLSRWLAWLGPNFTKAQAHSALLEQKLSPDTKSRYAAIVETYCKDMVTAGLLKENPLEGLSNSFPRKNRDFLPSFIRESEAQKVWDLLSKRPIRRWKDARDVALFALTYGSGLRSSDLKELVMRDLYLTEEIPFIYVSEKGVRRSRTSPVNPKSIPFVAHWLSIRSALNLPTDWVFPSTTQGTPMSTATAYRCVASLLDTLGGDITLPGQLGVATLRNSFLSRQFTAKMDINEVAKWCGHEDVTSTVRLNKKMSLPTKIPA